MPVPTMALYASPPSSVCSAPHPCQITSHSTFDFEVSSRSASSSAATTASPLPKAMIGGLSRLLSSQAPIRHASSPPPAFANVGGEELGSLWHGHDRSEELSSSFSYSSYSSLSAASSLKRDYQSPVSVLQGPVSCSASPPMRTAPDRSGDVHAQASFHAGSNGLFNGFVRNALESCIDYDSPSFQIDVGAVEVNPSGVLVDELTFDMEDDVIEPNSDPYAKDLLVGAQLRHEIFRDDFVVKAFYEAEKAHRGQMRASGDPYLQHCVETGVLLASIGANSTVVAAGLLHDTIDDSSMNYDYISATFGAGVADLVEGVSKLSQLSKLAREKNMADKTVEAARLHTMFLAMADARAVLIKLADRLHNMMTLDALPGAKQQRFAKETLEIFAPLANRLGISSWKHQLENLCFKHLNPHEHKNLSSKFVKSFDETMITTAIDKLDHALKDDGVSYHLISGRHKSLYSIYCKMLRKKLSMDEIHDIHGLRIIVESEEDCYKALKIVYELWSEVPGKLKDYINHPKFNGYQSLHAVVMGEGMAPLEVQIRTKDMHLKAEFGFAAHWRYKEGDCKYSSFVLQMVEWARWVITWQCQIMGGYQSSIGHCDSMKPPCKFPFHSDGCPFSYKPSSGHEGPVFVIMLENDKMSVQEFPENSTMVDLLERAGWGSLRWTPYRSPMKEELRPRLNRKPVSDPTCKLSMGDLVELTPAISDKSLTVYREEIQRMYDGVDLVASMPPPATGTVAGRS